MNIIQITAFLHILGGVLLVTGFGALPSLVIIRGKQ
jgi:hypothetical protein